MLTSVSPELRKIGDVCLSVAKKVEASQVEDGDPPFAIGHDESLRLANCYSRLAEIISATCK